MACMTNQQITPSRSIAAMAADRTESVCGSKRLAPHTSKPTSAVKPMSVPKTTGSFILIFCAIQTHIRPTSVATYVAIRIGRKTSAGLAAPSCARYAMMVVGMSVSPLAPRTTNIIMALEAFDLSLFSSCNSPIALSPIGVAALSRPSMFAAIFISIEPKTGCPFGISGKMRLKNGLMALPSVFTAPACSPIFIIPIHKASTPVRPKESSKPVLALSKVELRIAEKISTLP